MGRSYFKCIENLTHELTAQIFINYTIIPTFYKTGWKKQAWNIVIQAFLATHLVVFKDGFSAPILCSSGRSWNQSRQFKRLRDTKTLVSLQSTDDGGLGNENATEHTIKTPKIKQDLFLWSLYI